VCLPSEAVNYGCLFPSLEPLQILAAKYSGSVGVVLKLRLPSGRDALAFSSLSMDDPGPTSPFLERIAGTLLVAIPPKLNTQELAAIKHGKMFRGMSESALSYALWDSRKRKRLGKRRETAHLSGLFVRLYG
jgi:hypothetical protein